MRITNLQLHESTDPEFTPYYTADLVEDERMMSVQFSQNAGRNEWTVYNELTGNAFPILFVGGPNKMNDITTWRNGDCIELGVCIPKP